MILSLYGIYLQKIKIMETGLIVDFGNSNIFSIENLLENSEFFGYEMEDGKYIFTSTADEYDILEMALTVEFDKYNIEHYNFEGV